MNGVHLVIIILVEDRQRAVAAHRARFLIVSSSAGGPSSRTWAQIPIRKGWLRNLIHICREICCPALIQEFCFLVGWTDDHTNIFCLQDPFFHKREHGAQRTLENDSGMRISSSIRVFPFGLYITVSFSSSQMALSQKTEADARWSYDYRGDIWLTFSTASQFREPPFVSAA